MLKKLIGTILLIISGFPFYIVGMYLVGVKDFLRGMGIMSLSLIGIWLAILIFQLGVDFLRGR